MDDHLPEPLLNAQKSGTEFFVLEGNEWKLEFKGSVPHIEKVVGCPVYVFANNGFGDHLFLKKRPDGNGFDAVAFEFFHETQEVNRLSDNLETLLGLTPRPPSSDTYPKAIYESGEPIELGDKVRIKVWVEFWKGWQDGVVEYVPGISRKNPKHEYGGLKWVAIRFNSGQICPVVHPETGKLKKVRFVERAKSTTAP